MAYLLDTCVISDFIKGEPNTLTRLRSTPPAQIFISALTLMELRYGLLLNPAKARTLQPMIESLVNTITILSFDADAASHAAHIRSSLKTQGTPIGAYDLLIGATATVHGLTLVTANVREFSRIPGLTIENWRADPQEQHP